MIMTHFLLALSLSLAAAAAPVITLERTACFGRCPMYKVKIFADGKVVYRGQEIRQAKRQSTGSDYEERSAAASERVQ